MISLPGKLLPASAAVFFAFSIAACCGTSSPPSAKGPLPPGTPPPEYEAPRAYDLNASPAQTAAPTAPTAPPPAQPAPASD